MKNRSHYSVSSVMLYNDKCKQFFREYDWVNSFAYDMDLEDIKLYYPFSDETTINVLLWKYGFKKRIQRSQMNIDDLSNVKEYYESNYDKEKEITGYVRVPSKTERNKILFFHGAKGELSNSILELQKNLFDVNLDPINNKVYINPKIDFDRVLEIVFVDPDNRIFYNQFSKFNLGYEFWYSPNKSFNDLDYFQIFIYEDGRLIFKKKC